MTTEYYVLRLYRRDKCHMDELLGTLEDTAGGALWSFKCKAELAQVIEELAHPEKENESRAFKQDQLGPGGINGNSDKS